MTTTEPTTVSLLKDVLRFAHYKRASYEAAAWALDDSAGYNMSISQRRQHDRWKIREEVWANRAAALSTAIEKLEET
jgi:hypothetical protein